jgi:hypothetical protein
MMLTEAIVIGNWNICYVYVVDKLDQPSTTDQHQSCN